MTQWIKCSERMPEDAALLFGPACFNPLWGWWSAEENRWWYFDGVDIAWHYRNHFTHWMPLPEPPTD